MLSTLKSEDCKLTVVEYFIVGAIILLVIVLFYKNNNESFDARIEGSTKVQCGTICSKVLGCSGFAYDADNKNCYLARDKIIYSPARRERPRHLNVFAEFYKKDMPRCNKLYVINDPLYNSRNNLLRNITYTCQDFEEGPATNKIYNGEEIPIDDVTKINQLSPKPYTFEKIKWEDVINLDKNLELVINRNSNFTEKNTESIRQPYAKFNWTDF
jgi:hypothetical protein